MVMVDAAGFGGVVGCGLREAARHSDVSVVQGEKRRVVAAKAGIAVIGERVAGS